MPTPAFPQKAWQNVPSAATAISANALKDLEQRTADWAYCNVSDLAADGSTDDQPAIQAACDEAAAAGGGVVNVGNGTIVLDSLLEVDANVSLVGAGAYTTTFKCTDSTAGIKFVRDTNSRGGFSGSFKLDMNETSTKGLWFYGVVNKDFRNIRVENVATNGVACQVDDAQNCHFYGLDLQGYSTDGGPTGTSGIVFDRGASGNRVYGIRTNRLTADAIRIRMSAENINSGADVCRNNSFWGGMVERGNVGTTYLINISCGENNYFSNMSMALSGGTISPTSEYSIVKVEKIDDGPSSETTVTNIFDSCNITGGLNGSTRYATAWELNGANCYTTVVNCRTVNVKYPFKFSNAQHLLIEDNNKFDSGQTARYTGSSSTQRPNYDSAAAASSIDTLSGYRRVMLLSGTTTVNSIDNNAPVGHQLTLVGTGSSKTISASAGNIKTQSGSDLTLASGTAFSFVHDGVNWFQT